jgi:hypothetical protein
MQGVRSFGLGKIGGKLEKIWVFMECEDFFAGRGFRIGPYGDEIILACQVKLFAHEFAPGFALVG